MPRALRTAPGGFVYHVLNRAHSKRTIFHRDRDYLAFEDLLSEVQESVPMRTLAWCLMPNHWHLLLWPLQDGDLSRYMHLVKLRHTQRLHAYRGSAGTGQVYQGRFKSFVVQNDAHFLTVSRYVEANALTANLVRRAEDWRWGSLWRVRQGLQATPPFVHEWPLDRPNDWLEYVNRPVEAQELKALRRSARRGCPYGDEAWVASMAEELGLQSTLRPRGRPAKGDRTLTPFPEKGP